MTKRQMHNGENVHLPFFTAGMKNQSFLSTPLETVEKSDRCFMVKADIADYETMEQIVERYEVDYIVNFAAESHNSNSIINPTAFYKTNLLGLQTLMEVVRNNKRIKRIHHISTCEVYGDMELDSEQSFDENSPLGGEFTL